MLCKDLAVVLKSIQYEERSRIVTAITSEHGVITGFAKNSVQSRRFGGTLELFVASEWHFSLKPGSELCQISETHFKESFPGIMGNFEKLALASALSEMMIRVAPKHEACPNLFRLHCNALAMLNGNLEDGYEMKILNAYLAKLLQWTGHQPRLGECLQCSRSLLDLEPTEDVGGLISQAGWNCNQCLTKQGVFSLVRMKAQAVRDVQLFFGAPIRQAPLVALASKQDHIRLFEFLEEILIFHVAGFDGQPIKSLQFLGLKERAPSVFK